MQHKDLINGVHVNAGGNICDNYFNFGISENILWKKALYMECVSIINGVHVNGGNAARAYLIFLPM